MKQNLVAPGRYSLRCVLALVLVLVLAGCATTMSQPPEEAVKARAQERLDLILAEDFVAAYEFLSPGYRSGVSLNDYQRRMLRQRMQWNGARAGASDCSEDACKVRISIDYTIYGALPGVGSFESKAASTEDWVRVNGQWYFVPSA